MKYQIKPSNQFKRDVRKAVRRGYDTELLTRVIELLAAGEPLPEKYRDHALSGNYKGCRECHVTPDWLLVYEIDGENLFLYLVRAGTHADLFGK